MHSFRKPPPLPQVGAQSSVEYVEAGEIISEEESDDVNPYYNMQPNPVASKGARHKSVSGNLFQYQEELDNPPEIPGRRSSFPCLRKSRGSSELWFWNNLSR